MLESNFLFVRLFIRPILALLQRNAKAEYANYNNINALHFCNLQFAICKEWGCRLGSGFTI